jgi:DNA excision repair protein ERCC-5
MGVSGLWELLQPVGRTVDLATMANRRYAVDASIWITQFIKAMRDEDGEYRCGVLACCRGRFWRQWRQ